MCILEERYQAAGHVIYFKTGLGLATILTCLIATARSFPQNVQLPVIFPPLGNVLLGVIVNVPIRKFITSRNPYHEFFLPRY